jgi:hypothetical protein
MISADGSFVIAVGNDQKYCLWSLRKKEVYPLPGLKPNEKPFQWTPDSRSVYAYNPDEMPAKVYALDVATGQRRFIREIVPSDTTGVTTVSSIRFLPDEKYYAYEYNLRLGTLYLITGLK